jgi:hypothetical protein
MCQLSRDSPQEILVGGTDSSVYEEDFWTAKCCYLALYFVRHMDGLSAPSRYPSPPADS